MARAFQVSFARTMSVAYYQPSGRIAVLGVLGGLVGGGLASLLVGFVYAAALVYFPIVQLAIFLPIAFGATSAAITMVIAERCRQRNAHVAVALVLATTSIGYFGSWIPWLYLTLRANGAGEVPIVALLDPPFVLAMLGQIYEVGAWSVSTSGRETDVSGMFLGVVWVLEMATVLGTATFLGWAEGVRTVFCERCESWCTATPALVRFALEAEPELVRRLGLRDFSVIGQMPRARANESALVLSLHRCLGCGHTNTVRVIRSGLDRKGRPTSSRVAPIVPHLLVEADEAARILELAG